MLGIRGNSIAQDAACVRRLRMRQELPFQWARRPCSRGLWYDLAERKAALEAQQRIPAVVRADPVGIPMPAFVRAEPGGIPMPAFVPAEREGIPDPWRALEEARIRVPEGDRAAEVQQVSSRTRRNKISQAGVTSSISGGDSGSPPSGIGDLPFLTSSSISSIDVRSADPPSGMGTGERGEPFLPPYGGLDALDQSWR